MAAHHYQAFISYSHADEKLAAAFHKRLERFPVPRGLSPRGGESAALPGRIRPVFRDREEFPASADLGSSIRRALERSASLVVICSPQSAASSWVGEEIRYFKQLGRSAKIFCLIIAGTPSIGGQSQEASGALHSALLENYDDHGKELSGTAPEPLAIDIREAGLGTATVKIAAGILGVNYDTLHQRFRQRRRRELLFLAVVAGTVIAALWWQSRETARERQYSLAQDLAAIAYQQVYEQDPVAGMALALHAIAMLPDGSDSAMLRANARKLLSRGRIATLAGGIENIVPDGNSTTMLLDRSKAPAEIRSIGDGTLRVTLPTGPDRVRFFSEGPGYFLAEYGSSRGELRNSSTGTLIMALRSPVADLQFGPHHLFARSAGGQPHALRRLDGADPITLDDGARLDSVSFGSERSDLMVLRFGADIQPRLHRMSDDARINLAGELDHIDLSTDTDSNRLLVRYRGGGADLLRSKDLSLVRRFNTGEAPQGFWPRGSRLLSFQREDRMRVLVDIEKGTDIALGSRLIRSRDPDRSMVAVVSSRGVHWFSDAGATELGGVAGTFTDARFSRDTPPSRIALHNRLGWQLHDTSNGALIAELPAVRHLYLGSSYLLTSTAESGKEKPDSVREIRRLGDGRPGMTLNSGTDRVTFVSSDLALVESKAGSRRFYRLPSGRPLKVPPRRNIEFDAPLGPAWAFHMISYSDGRTEIRSGVDGSPLAWIGAKIASPSHITFLPITAPTHILVNPPDRPSEILPLTAELSHSEPVRNPQGTNLQGVVAKADLLPGFVQDYLLLRYRDGRAEIWQGPQTIRRLAVLKDNLKDFLLSDTGDRLVLHYADGSAEILDLPWLVAATAPDISDNELIDLACKGPLSNPTGTALAPYLHGEEWRGCNGATGAVSR